MGSDNDSVEFISSLDLIRKPAHIHACEGSRPIAHCPLVLALLRLSSSGAETLSAGPLFHEFSLPLSLGNVSEALGPSLRSGKERRRVSANHFPAVLLPER
jgi:hypothetical protein